jgi:trk system potassium uptake protein
MKVMIVGAGKLGYKIAEAMILEDIDVTLVDDNSKVIQRVNQQLDVLTVVDSGINVKMLKEFNIDTFDLLIATTENDSTNAVICAFAKKLGCARTIARIRNPEYTAQLDFIKTEMGIDHIVNPDYETAHSIAKYLMRNVVYYSGEFGSGKAKMIDYNIGHNADFINKKIKDIEGLKDLLITAISRAGEMIIPNGSFEMKEGDVAHVLGKEEDIIKFSKTFKLIGKERQIQKVMILGGGNLAYYLAKELIKSKVEVTIIEQDRVRANKLAELLENVLIISGDGTDVGLLEEENIAEMDAFIGATGYDEQNLLMALLAKQYGICKCIAKVSRPNYTKIIDKLNIDVAINPVNTTAGNILKIIRGGKVLSVSLLLGGKGEVTEIIATPDMSYIDKPISELHLPERIIIGAIIKKGEVVIPKGNTVINAYDRIVVFSLTEDFETLKSFFKPKKGGLLSEIWNRGKGSRFNTPN